MQVFIQNEAGSFIKNYHNEKTLQWLRCARVSRPYPFPYGFVLHTSAADGCNVDCFVLTPTPLRVGQIVDCEPIGLMEQMEDGVEDHNVLAALPDEPHIVDRCTQELLIEFVHQVFEHVEGKQISVGRFVGKEAALDYVAQHEDLARKD